MGYSRRARKRTINLEIDGTAVVVVSVVLGAVVVVWAFLSVVAESPGSYPTLVALVCPLFPPLYIPQVQGEESKPAAGGLVVEVVAQ